MNVEIGTETPMIYLFWQYFFQIFDILSLEGACLWNLVAKVLQLWVPVRTLPTIDGEPVILLYCRFAAHGLRAPRGSCWWLYIIRAGKGCAEVSDGPVHMPLEGWPLVSEATRHPLVFKHAEGGCDGFLHILWVNRDLMMPFLHVNLQPAALGAKSSMLGRGKCTVLLPGWAGLKSPQKPYLQTCPTVHIVSSRPFQPQSSVAKFLVPDGGI